MQVGNLHLRGVMPVGWNVAAGFLPAMHRPDGRCDAGRKPAPTKSGASNVAAGFLPALHRPDGRCDAGRKPAPTRRDASHVAAGFLPALHGLGSGVMQVGNLHLREAVPRT